MGLWMEKFGAEEMEVQLFLFTVLQIHLFSPWSTRRGLCPWPRGGGGARLFHQPRAPGLAPAWPLAGTLSPSRCVSALL